jgi:hypothetical protein
MDGRPDDLTLARLVLTRARRAGMPFDLAWPRVFEALPVLPSAGPAKGREALDRDRTLGALAATVEWWRTAYEHRPPPPSPHTPAAVAARWREMGLLTRSQAMGVVARRSVLVADNATEEVKRDDDSCRLERMGGRDLASARHR